MKELDMSNLIGFKNEKEKDRFRINMLNLKFINKIIKILKEKNIEMKQFAKMLKISIKELDKLFNGDKKLNFKMLIKIQKVLDIVFEIEARKIK